MDTTPPRRRRPEILAPAGTQEAFRAALASGADAIYLGLAEGFNARGRSNAFRLDDLPDLAARAHAAGACLYLTVNTLIFEKELDGLESLLREVVRSGVDALIVQDPATAFLARHLSSDIRLHASTQMTISSVEGGEFAKTLGVERVVLPRELSVDEIARFTRESTLETEVFVHGALCMAWSGQCLTSEAFSDRSANRGRCSQACRMPYEAIVDGEKLELGDLRYLLSPQDLAAHEVLPELVEANVRSLKIEGRYKGPAYVSAAVDSWRHWRDAVLTGPTDDDRAQLRRDFERTQLTYSRGGSLGFLRGDDHQSLVVATTPKHRGLPLGVVKRVRGKTAHVTLTMDEDARTRLRPGMGIKFELVGRSDDEHDPENAPGGPLFGVRFGRGPTAELRFGTPGPALHRVRPGDLVRWTGDPAAAREGERRGASTPEGRIPLVLRVAGRAGEPLSIEAHASAHRSFTTRVVGNTPLGPARSGTGLCRSLLEEKLGALGGTPFSLVDLHTDDLDPGLHVPVSELKRLRRQAVDALVVELRAPPPTDLPPSPVAPEIRTRLFETARAFRPACDDTPPALVALCRTEEQLNAIIEAGLVDEVELDWMEMVGLTRAVSRARAAGLTVTLATVRVQKPGEEAYDRRIQNLDPDGVLVRHWGALMHFSQQSGESGARPALRVHGDFSLNVTNSLTANHLLALGLETVTASFDLNRDQLLDLLENVPRGRVAVTLHHHIATFHNSHCVYAHLLSDGKDYRTCGRPCESHRIALRDYAGHDHPVVVDVSCRNTMFNATAQSAAPLVPRLLERGVRRFRVELVWETGDEVTRTMSAYTQLLRGELSPKAALEEAAVHERYGVTSLRVRRS